MDWYKHSRLLRLKGEYLTLTPSQKHYVTELCLLSFSEDTPGRLVSDEAAIRAWLSIGPKRWERLLDALVEKRIVHREADGTLALARWLFPHHSDAEMTGEMNPEPHSSNGNGHNGHRGKPSDDPLRVKERVARFRGKQDETPPVTPLEADCNAPDSHARVHALTPEAEAEAESFVFTKAEAEAEAPLPPSKEAEGSVSASASPAPPFEDKSSSASAPPTPSPVRLAGDPPPLLSQYDEKELLKSGWSLTEIDIGVAILKERQAQGKPVQNARGLLHSKLLAEVRAGKRPKGKPPPDGQEKITYSVNGGIPPELPHQNPPDMSALRNILHPPGQAHGT